MNEKVGKHFLANRDVFCKIWCIFQGFFDNFCWFLGYGDVWCKNRVAELIELVEFYLESGMRKLESISGRIATGFLENLLFYSGIWHFVATGSIELSWDGVHWIEVVRFYWVNEWVLESICGRIAPGFKKFDVFLSRILLRWECLV